MSFLVLWENSLRLSLYKLAYSSSVATKKTNQISALTFSQVHTEMEYYTNAFPQLHYTLTGTYSTIHQVKPSLYNHYDK